MPSKDCLDLNNVMTIDKIKVNKRGLQMQRMEGIGGQTGNVHSPTIL